MADNLVQARWAKGSPAIAAWMSTNSLLIAQTVASSGVDAVIIDIQHGSATMDDMLGLIASVEVRGAETFVRVPSIDAGLIGCLLDAGATGIIAPLVESAAQAQALVAALRYPPDGSRSFGPRIPALRFGPDYFKSANDGIVALAMIETSAGIAALDAIVAVEGLSGIFIGPSDLAISLGHSPSPKKAPDNVQSAIALIRSKAAVAGKKVGIFCPTPEAAHTAIGNGFALVTTIPDLALIDAGTRAAVTTLRQAVTARS